MIVKFLKKRIVWVPNQLLQITKRMNINHILLQATDLSMMASFINNVTGLEIGDRPPFPFPGAWMYNQDKAVIHIVEAKANAAQSDYLGSSHISPDGVMDHIAFDGDDYRGLISRLNQHDLVYVERTVPLSQEHQVFVEGPDGLRLEILFNHNELQ